MPVFEPFKNTKEVTFSFTSPGNNVSIDKNFKHPLRKYITTNLVIYVDMDFILDNYIQHIISNVGLELKTHEKIVFSAKNKVLDTNVSLYNCVKNKAIVTMNVEKLPEYWNNHIICKQVTSLDLNNDTKEVKKRRFM